MRKYKLVGRQPVPCDDLIEWARAFAPESRRVARDQIGPCLISTVFLGSDHNWSDEGPPLLFETMIFGGEHHEYQTRAATWGGAEKAHAEAVALVRAAADTV
jgi:hypothetical protein